MPYNVYITYHHGVIQHVRIFIETKEDGSGKIYHVTGTVLMGMELQIRDASRPDDSATYIPGTQTLVGRMHEADLARFEAAARAVPPPGAQVKLNGRPKDPTKPVRRCGEWVEELKEKAIAEGIVTPSEV
ncbi:uncharacterized protein K452DRAFT_237404 [Aplosporella prunicola CBS 121167]|uniref:Uncharacterized protein n=1 Tax=Aplosporella prunicola CBS 121167 TaxID=1176127 RepID=A0A6A6B191_9PEZI|nr:uncharacterized protein K452DRAFT_237404 [Aplosporella prunicola CBS 121167]KAF2136501.1 hypothetical protein K452DRAFT_237404 [Aplosporella prunicola CBS 121167]